MSFPNEKPDPVATFRRVFPAEFPRMSWRAFDAPSPKFLSARELILMTSGVRLPRWAKRGDVWEAAV